MGMQRKQEEVEVTSGTSRKLQRKEHQSHDEV